MFMFGCLISTIDDASTLMNFLYALPLHFNERYLNKNGTVFNSKRFRFVTARAWVVSHGLVAGSNPGRDTPVTQL